MTCPNKFLDDVGLDRLTFDPRILVIGTFTPDCIHREHVQWFHGAMGEGINDHVGGDHFWSVLPRLYGERSLRFEGAELLWKDFCNEHRIALTDLILGIEDFELSDDPDLENVCSCSEQIHSNAFLKLQLNDILALLAKYPSIGYVYFTGNPDNKYWKKICKPISEYCKANKIYYAGLTAPSEVSISRQKVYNSRIHPDAPVQLDEYILRSWKDKWHPACFIPCCSD